MSIWDTKASFLQGLWDSARDIMGSLGALPSEPAVSPALIVSHVTVCGAALSLLLSVSLVAQTPGSMLPSLRCAVTPFAESPLDLPQHSLHIFSSELPADLKYPPATSSPKSVFLKSRWRFESRLAPEHTVGASNACSE